MRAVWWWATEMVPVPRLLALALFLHAAIQLGAWLVGR